MSDTPAFRWAADIETTLELVVERCGDPAPRIYARVFAQHPQMKPYFWRDTNDAVKGEMLSRTFAALLDFIGERRYADHMIGNELITHEGYDVPREVFASFFTIIRDSFREILGPDWTPAFERAWNELLADIDHFVQKTPRVGSPTPVDSALREQFEAGQLTPGL
jgi:hemoglobin-like flavoprotein